MNRPLVPSSVGRCRSLSNDESGLTNQTTNSCDRMELSRPIVYGNSAKYFGFTRSDGHTHEWTLYVRPYRQSHDLNQYIKKVIFVLEPYYPNEEVCQAPYEIKRTGWGEFDIDIKLVFKHRSMRTLTLHHYLRLVEYAGEDQTPIYTCYMQSETYDEIVISKPSAKIKALFQNDEHKAHDATKRNTRADLLGIQPSSPVPSMGRFKAIAESPEKVGEDEMSESGQETMSSSQDEHSLRRITQLTNILRGKERVLAEINRLKLLLLRNHHEIKHYHACIDAWSLRNPSFEREQISKIGKVCNE